MSIFLYDISDLCLFKKNVTFIEQSIRFCSSKSVGNTAIVYAHLKSIPSLTVAVDIQTHIR